MIVRERYLRRIRPFIDDDLVKVLTGIRRCGKSVILKQIESELKAKGKKTLTLNFEDLAVSSIIRTDGDLLAYVEKFLGEDKLYVFLDEVQAVQNWNIACRTLRLKNLSLFITGSNSKLLSREFTKELSGRYVSFQIRPFVFKEIEAYARQLGREADIDDYIVYGGFPKVQEQMPDKEAVRQYLNDLDQTIVMYDIMNRYRVKKTELFRRLVNFVLLSNAQIFSAAAVLRALKGEGFECTLNTVMKFLGYLTEAYVIREVPQYSGKAKRELRYYRKIYDEDVAFNSIRQQGNRFDYTHNLENIVFNELIYMGYEVYVFTDGDKEIDFLAIKDKKEYMVQVAWSIVEESTYQREFALFNKLDGSRKKIIITNDTMDFSTTTVTHIQLKDFLRMESLQEAG